MTPSVSSVTCRTDFELELRFSNGEVRVLDMSPYLDCGIFAKLKDANIFKSVHVSFDTIAWSTGADLDPEFVYKKSRPLSVEQKDTTADSDS